MNFVNFTETKTKTKRIFVTFTNTETKTKRHRKKANRIRKIRKLSNKCNTENSIHLQPKLHRPCLVDRYHSLPTTFMPGSI